MKKLIIFFSVILFLSSCSPQQRLSRLIKHHPELISKTDTVARIDTIIIPSSSTDTVFYYKQTDTIIKKENGVVIKYFYNTKDSTVYLKGERDSIIIIKEVPVMVNNSFPIEERSWLEKTWDGIKDYLLFALLISSIVLFLLVYRKSKPPTL